MAEAAVRAGGLQHLMAECAPTTPGLFLFHPGRKQMLPKLRAFIDHVRSLPKADWRV